MKKSAHWEWQGNSVYSHEANATKLNIHCARIRKNSSCENRQIQTVYFIFGFFIPNNVLIVLKIHQELGPFKPLYACTSPLNSIVKILVEKFILRIYFFLINANYEFLAKKLGPNKPHSETLVLAREAHGVRRGQQLSLPPWISQLWCNHLLLSTSGKLSETTYCRPLQENWGKLKKSEYLEWEWGGNYFLGIRNRKDELSLSSWFFITYT